MPTHGQIWGQRQFLWLITLSPALPPPTLSSLCLSLYLLNLCVLSLSSSSRVCVSSARFWAGVWSCVLSTITNKPSAASIPRCTCACVLVAFYLVSISICFIFQCLTFTWIKNLFCFLNYICVFHVFNSKRFISVFSMSFHVFPAELGKCVHYLFVSFS